ncbi:MAG: hypothetical protein IPO43_15000 [Rhodoferax sp.]|nr:hypothetical protein [Rhodoferax sp.]
MVFSCWDYAADTRPTGCPAVGGEADGAGPEDFLQVHPGLRQLGPGLDLRQQRTREHQSFADPVGLVDDAQAVGVAVGDEDAEGERGFHLHIKMSLM